jgi:RNA polymerase sigma factor (sigma-70 family)
MAEERDQSRQRHPLVVEPPTGEPPLWIDERDRKGRPVEPTVKEAAGRIWRRVLYYVRRERNDHAEAAEVLEEAVFSVSARLQSEDELAPIQNLDSYLFHSFVRRFSKRAQREDRIQYFESAEALDSLGAGSQGDWVAELENEILLKQVIGAMEPRVREMFALRSAGHSWKEVGRQFGISAHNAEVQFAYGLKKAKAQLGLDEEPPQSRRVTK